MSNNTKRQKKGEVQKVLVLVQNETEYFIVFSYGDGTACLATTDCPDGHLRTEYCQERFNKDFVDLFEELSYGKMYMKDWDGSDDKSPLKTEVDGYVVKDAVSWLCVGAHDFTYHYKNVVKKVNNPNIECTDIYDEIKNFLG
jgi:hypothetical protein